MVRLRVRGGSVVGCSARGTTLGIHLLLCKLCRLSMSVVQSNKIASGEFERHRGMAFVGD